MFQQEKRVFSFCYRCLCRYSDTFKQHWINLLHSNNNKIANLFVSIIADLSGLREQRVPQIWAMYPFCTLKVRRSASAVRSNDDAAAVGSHWHQDAFLRVPIFFENTHSVEDSRLQSSFSHGFFFHD